MVCIPATLDRGVHGGSLVLEAAHGLAYVDFASMRSRVRNRQPKIWVRFWGHRGGSE